MNYVIRHGRRIEVEDIDMGVIAKPKRAAERYVQITETGAKGFEAFGGPAALVWFEILYQVWKTGKTTIGLANKPLARMGVSRWAKYRAVDCLEQEGWVQASRRNGRATQITLLKPGCVVFRGK